MSQDTVNILWTNGDAITSEKMVLMYATNAKIHDWWKDINVYIWGAPAKLIADSELIQEKIRMAIHVGVKFVACKACSDQLGVTDQLTSLKIDVRYLGEALTEMIKNKENLLTI